MGTLDEAIREHLELKRRQGAGEDELKQAEAFGPAEDDETVDLAVLECVARLGGSISAEHGIGRGKAELLGLSRSAAEMSAMRAVKTAWDPQGLMNPGVLFS